MLMGITMKEIYMIIRRQEKEYLNIIMEMSMKVIGSRILKKDMVESLVSVGTYKFSNGDQYTGEWKRDRMNGNGILFKRALGTFTYANGDVFEGEWKEGQRDGKGVMNYANEDKYDGDWKEDKKNGRGVLTTKDGDTYEGEYKDDLKDGRGKYQVNE